MIDRKKFKHMSLLLARMNNDVKQFQERLKRIDTDKDTQKLKEDIHTRCKEWEHHTYSYSTYSLGGMLKSFQKELAGLPDRKKQVEEDIEMLLSIGGKE